MVTVEINEKSRAGKAILELLKIFSKEKNDVKIIAPGKTEKKNEKVPNAETRKAMENAKKGIDVKKFNNVNELFEELNS